MQSVALLLTNHEFMFVHAVVNTVKVVIEFV